MTRMLLLALISCLVVLPGCASHAPTPSSTPIEESAPEHLEAALAIMSEMPRAERATLALSWAAEYLAASRLPEAGHLLATLVPTSLGGAQRLDWVKLSARLALAKQSPEVALDLIESGRLNVPTLLSRAPQATQNDFALLKADALVLAGMVAQSLQLRVSIEPALSGDDHIYNQQMVWLLLLNLTQSDLQALAAESTGDLLGWIELALLYRDPLDDMDAQTSKLSLWEDRWPGHPAAENPPEMIEALRHALDQRPATIAVLLPMSGPLATAGKTIANGMISVWFLALEKQQQRPQIRFYDSGMYDVTALYDQAVSEGAELIIGPLDKSKVAQLAEYDHLSIPVLALNYVDEQHMPENFFQFGLSPEDEARQVARRSWMEGAQLAAMLYPQTEWGQRMATTFAQSWESEGGLLTSEQAFAQNHSDAVSMLLDIPKSRARARAMAQYFDDLQFEPRRRKDLDFIFLAASPDQARQIKPALNFHYGSDIAIRATSHIYSGMPEPIRDIDLNSVQFVDIPWLLDQSTSLHLITQEAWPEGHGRYARLFALGIDAYRLHARIGLMKQVPTMQLPGATGHLQLREDDRIVRELDWAVFRNGQPVRLPIVAPRATQRTVRDPAADATER